MGLDPMTKRVKLTLEELKKAKPLPHIFDSEWQPDPEVFLWVINNISSWKPKRIKGLHGRLIEPIPFKDGLTYDAIAIKPDDTLYLVDAAAHAILYESDGTKTAENIIIMLFNEMVEVLEKNEPDNPLVKSIRKGKSDENIESMFYVFYRHLAMLKKEGLIE